MVALASEMLYDELEASGYAAYVGGGEEVSMLDAIELLGRISGRRLEVVHGPRREGDQARTSADTSRIRRSEEHTS